MASSGPLTILVFIIEPRVQTTILSHLPNSYEQFFNHFLNFFNFY